MCVANKVSWLLEKNGKHISSFHNVSNVFIYEKHIIYVFVLFSHNFIINVYHHYCSYSISHSSVLILLPDEKLFASFSFYFCLGINSGHEKKKLKDGKFPIFRDFRISKGYIFWYEEALRGFSEEVNSVFTASFLRFRHVTVYLSC